MNSFEILDVYNDINNDDRLSKYIDFDTLTEFISL